MKEDRLVRTGTKKDPCHFFFTLVASLAEMERGIISERTAAAHAHKRSKGEACGHAPFGYRLASDGITLERAPYELETLEVISAMKANGLSQRMIVSELNRQGRPAKHGGKWHRSSLRSVLATLERRPTTI